MAKILVLYHSDQDFINQLALAVAHGAREVAGAEVALKCVPSLAATKPQPEAAQPEELKEYDALIFGFPARFGGMCAEMSAFLDKTSAMWMAGELVGRVGGVFVSTPTQHGGHEMAINHCHAALLHHGMMIVGVPHTEKGLVTMAEMSGGSPYGAGTISALDNLRAPSDNEFDLAEALGRRIANITVRLYG